MTTNQKLLTELYEAFNARDIDRVFAGMRDDLQWPKASEGGVVEGKPAIRAYWTRQWQEFDPHVEPLHVDEVDGKTRVAVRQRVKSLQGDLLSDSVVLHLYTIADGLVARMELGDSSSAAAAFHGRNNS